MTGSTDPTAPAPAVPVRLRTVDPHRDDALWHDVHAVLRRSRLHEREGMPFWTVEAFLGALRSPDEGERFEVVVAHADGEPDRPLGVAFCYLFLLDNLDKAWLEVDVDPAHRRHGVGTALLRHVEAMAAEAGRAVLMADARVPVDRVADHGYRRFAEAHGYGFSNVEVVRHAPLPVPEETLDSWQAQAAEKAAGYEVRTLVNEMPADLAPGLGALMGLLGVDAPTGEVDFEEEVFSPARLVERLETVRAMGRDLYETVALAPDGTVAAQTTLSAPATGAAGADPTQTDAWQWGTFVHREHRGHRLGLAVKTANLRAVQTDHPGLTRVTTQNAETNRWMIAINELMGFRPVEASLEVVKRR